MVTVKIDFAKPRGIGNYKNTVAWSFLSCKKKMHFQKQDCNCMHNVCIFCPKGFSKKKYLHTYIFWAPSPIVL